MFVKNYLVPGHRMTMRSFKTLSRQTWVTLAMIAIFNFIAETMVTLIVPESPEEPFLRQLTIILGLFILTQIVAFLLYLLLPARILEAEEGRRAAPITGLSRKHGKDLVNETLRVAAQVIFGLIMFIIPGLIRGVRYGFVPFIVTSDKTYMEGKRDALEYSSQLIKGITLALAILWLALFGLEYLLSSGAEYSENFSEPLYWVLWRGVFSAVIFAITCYGMGLDFSIYRIRAREVKPAN
jgi:hypothetical protein